MTVLLGVFCALVGLAVGSFLNVVIWRVSRGESVISPGSHCPSCAEPISNRDNVPVLSWLLLRGRCRHCSIRISARYPLVELLTALFFVVVGVHVGFTPVLPAFLFLTGSGVALAAIDIDVHRLPDVLTFPTLGIGLITVVLVTLLQGQPGQLLRAAVGMLGLCAFYFVTLLVYPKGMGLGDVKLAAVLGLYLAYLGWAELAVGVFLAFLLGGLGGMLLIALRHGTRKSVIPFGPYMLLGALIGILAGGPIARAYLSVTIGQ